MISVYSKIQPGSLLHLLIRADDFKEGRKDVVSPNEFIQCALLKMNKGKTFEPHLHVWKEGEKMAIAQECWVVIKGEVNCIYYDSDGTYLEKYVLRPGDASVTLFGGHNYEITKDGTLVYEFKTGPYKGQEKDKEFIYEK